MRERDLPAKSGRDLIAKFLFCFVLFWFIFKEITYHLAEEPSAKTR